MTLTFGLPARRIYCNTRVRANIGRVALMRGPVVYCFEGTDNDGDLQELMLPVNAEIRERMETEGVLKGMVTLAMDGIRVKQRRELYSEERPKEERAVLKAIPYFAWGNRGMNQMRVWIPETADSGTDDCGTKRTAG